MKWLGAYREQGINALLTYDVGGNPGTPRQPKEAATSGQSQASTSSKGASRQTLLLTSELAERIDRFVASQLGDSLTGKLRPSSGLD